MDSRRGRTAVFVLCLAGLGVAAYLPALLGGFQSDDFELIGRVAEGGLYATWNEPLGGFLRPVIVFSYWLDLTLWGKHAWGFHLTNLLFHIAASGFVALFAIELFEKAGVHRKSAPFLAGTAGVLFLLLPSHSEAVAWISGRTDVIAGCMMAASLAAWGHYAVRGRRWCFAASLVCYAVALYAKESAITFPAVIFVVQLLPLKREGFLSRAKEALARSVPYCLLLAVYLATRVAVLGELVGGYGTHRHLRFDVSFVAAQLVKFTARAFVPALPQDCYGAIGTAGWFVLGILAACGLVILGVAALAKSNRPSLALAAPLVTLFYVALVPVYAMPIFLNGTEGERFLYFPSIFTCLGVALVFGGLFRPAQRVRPVVALICAISGVALFQLNGTWRDAGELAERLAAQVAEESGGERVVVLNVPDNYRGAYVFRNGLPHAVAWFEGVGEVEDVLVGFAHDVRALDDAVLVRPTLRRVWYEVQLENPDALFKPGARSPEVKKVRLRDGHGQMVDISAVPTPRTVLYYSEGQISLATPLRD